MPRDVIDKDLGWKAVQRRLLDAEDLQVRIGVLASMRYPKSGGGKKGTPVAKVAAVHGMVKAFADVWDRTDSKRAAALDRAHGAILGGQSAAQALVPVGNLHRNEMRKIVEKRKLIKSGRLLKTIKAAVFRGAKRVAGDEHNRPRASDPV